MVFVILGGGVYYIITAVSSCLVIVIIIMTVTCQERQNRRTGKTIREHIHHTKVDAPHNPPAFYPQGSPRKFPYNMGPHAHSLSNQNVTLFSFVLTIDGFV